MRKIAFAVSVIAMLCAVFALALWAAPSGPSDTSAAHYPCDPPPVIGEPQGEFIQPFTFINTTSAVASDLCVVYAGSDGTLNSLQVVGNPPGCPDPPLNVEIAGFSIVSGDLVLIDWGLPCVQPGDSVDIMLQSAFSPFAPTEVIWTLEGDPITPTPIEETTTPEPTPVESIPPEETPTIETTTPTPHKTKNPITDDWPDLRPAEEKAVKDLADAGKKGDALAKLVETMKKYCCSFGTMKGGAPVYDSALGGEGSTERAKGGEVKIGDDAFTSVPWLYSSLKHEMVHSQQWQDPAAAGGQGSNGREKQAYQREIDNADNTDIDAEEKKDLEERVKDYGGSAQPGDAVPLGDTLGLGISMTKDVFNSDEDIPLMMTLENLTAAAVQANTRMLVNDADEPPSFREVSLAVTDLTSGQEIEFALDIRVGFPGEDDFSELAPAGAASAGTAENAANLSDLFALVPGRYEVCAAYQNTLSGPIVFDPDSGEFVEQNIGAVKTSVESNCLAFLIGPFGRQGDVDCDGDEDAVDALQELRNTAALGVSQSAPCPEIGSEFASFFGDVDCDDDVDSVDALKILRSVAAFSVAQTEPCPDIGESLAPAAPASEATATGPGLPLAAVAGLAFAAVGLVGVGGAYSRRRWRL